MPGKQGLRTLNVVLSTGLHKDAVRDMDMCQHSGLDDCSLCIQGTVTNTPMLLRTRVEVRPGAMIDTDVAVINVQSIGGARYFFSLINEASVQVSASDMKSKVEAAELLKRQFSWIE